MDMGRTPCPALDRLPPELLLRIFVFVAKLGTPQLLLNLAQTCRTFHSLLIPPNNATDKNIWKCAAWAVLGDHAPEILLHDDSYQAFVRRLIALYHPPDIPDSSKTSIDFRPLRHCETLTTSASGAFPVAHNQRLAARAARSQPPDYPTYDINTCPLPPVLKGTTRTYDFLHTCTEASRPLEDYAYLSVSPCSTFFLFADDPRGFPSRFQFGRGSLISGANYPLQTHLPHPPFASTQPPDIHAYNHQSLHSDPDLVLIPSATSPTEIVAVKNLASGHKWRLADIPHEFPDYFETAGSITEFRSAGPYLAFCADSGPTPSSPPVLSCAHTDGSHWTRPITPAPTTILENDGLKMTVSTIAFASRRYRSHPTAQSRPHMKFYLFSTSSGDLIRTLSLHQESLNVYGSLPLPDAWCSFALSHTHLIATVGGHDQDGARWQYPSLLVWELRQGGRQSPAYLAPLPKEWRNNADTYVTFSRTGREAVVSSRWSCAVWDMCRKAPAGVWNVPAGRMFYDPVRHDPNRPEPRDLDSWWNGLWVGFRDVADKTGETTARGVGYFVTDVFREFFGRYGERGVEDTGSTRGDDGIVWVVDREGVWRSEGRRREGAFHGYNGSSAMGDELQIRWEDEDEEEGEKEEEEEGEEAEAVGVTDSEGWETETEGEGESDESDDDEDSDGVEENGTDLGANEGSDVTGSSDEDDSDDESGSSGDSETDGSDGSDESGDNSDNPLEIDLDVGDGSQFGGHWSQLMSLIGVEPPAGSLNTSNSSSDGSESDSIVSTTASSSTDDPTGDSMHDSSGSSTIGPPDSSTTASVDDSALSSADDGSDIEWLATTAVAAPAQPTYIILSDTE